MTGAREMPERRHLSIQERILSLSCVGVRCGLSSGGWRVCLGREGRGWEEEKPVAAWREERLQTEGAAEKFRI